MTTSLLVLAWFWSEHRLLAVGQNLCVCVCETKHGCVLRGVRLAAVVTGCLHLRGSRRERALWRAHVLLIWSCHICTGVLLEDIFCHLDEGGLGSRDM